MDAAKFAGEGGHLALAEDLRNLADDIESGVRTIVTVQTSGSVAEGGVSTECVMVGTRIVKPKPYVLPARKPSAELKA